VHGRLFVGSGAARTAEAADGGRADNTDERLRLLDADCPANHDRLRLLDDIDDDDDSDYLGSDDEHDDLRRDVYSRRDDDERRSDHDRPGGRTHDVSRGDDCCDDDSRGLWRARHNGDGQAEEGAA
jgi:hypothetical protein